jgi:hypothetical protein
MTRFQLIGETEPVSFDLGTGNNTVGRAAGNSVQIPEPSISSQHCVISVSSNGVYVQDLQSTNGTSIDGVPTVEGWLQPGQTLQLGNLRLRLETEEVRIHVPGVPAPVAEAGPVTLEDGSLACSRNPTLAANFSCTKCERPFHGSSLRQVRLSGGKSVMVFCPECDGKCEVIPGAVKDSGRKSGFFSRLTQTLQLGWKKK